MSDPSRLAIGGVPRLIGRLLSGNVREVFAIGSGDSSIMRFRSVSLGVVGIIQLPLDVAPGEAPTSAAWADWESVLMRAVFASANALRRATGVGRFATMDSANSGPAVVVNE